MAKKIRQKKLLTKEEREAERERKAEEQAREQAGIDDDFQARGFELAEWAQSNSGIVMGIIGVIVLAGLATFVVQYMEEQDGYEASLVFDEAHDAYNASLGDAPSFDGAGGAETDGPSYKDAKERATEARALFEKVVTTGESSGAGHLAQLYIGNTSIQLEDWDKAASAYEAFLDGASAADPMRFLAYDGLAIALEGKGDQAGAIAQLEKLVGLPTTVAEDIALLRLARLYEKTGDKDKARDRAQRLVNDFKESPMKGEAERLLAELGPAAG